MATLLACGGRQPTAVDQSVAQGNLSSALRHYEEQRLLHGPDVEALGQVAGLVLEQEASFPGSRRDAAIEELRRAGDETDAVLMRLAARSQSKAARARALAILTERGDADAQQKLRRLLDDKDPEVVAAAIVALDPEADQAKLLALLGSPFGPIRESASRRLGQGPSQRRVLKALIDTARLDPLGSVRASAIHALIKYKALAKPAFRQGLKDSSPFVRHAAVIAAAQSGEHELDTLLMAELPDPPTEKSIDVAHALARLAPSEKAKAIGRAYVLKGLEAGDPRVRYDAATSLSTMASMEEQHGVIARAMQQETNIDTKVAMAGLLEKDATYAPKARRVFEEALTTEGLGGVEAAMILAKTDAKAPSLQTLERLMRTGTVEVRAAAAHALAWDAGEPDRARTALKAPHPRVRIKAAGGILLALSGG
ncbi:MAG: HEAT repeat domain-containing protein [Myxococcales bacterium]|nr:HEAT repeat domain-containing protein [Myxococcales bacterium]MCB9708834.1 HEAT repeat domain-containing protein [Myxococcales bacterium]